MRCDKRRAATLIGIVCFFVVFIVLFVGGASAQSSASQDLVYRKKYVMGTVFEIAAYVQSSEHANNAIERAFQEIIRLDDLMSNYKPESALSKLNRSAHFQEQEVDSDLYRVIEQAVQFSRLSDGKFDISIAPLVNLWKAALRGDGTPSRAQLEEVRSCVGYEKIEFISPDRIRFRSSCLQLDLGAIGKGFAVDRAAEVLRSLGIRNALINAGGSTMLAMGSPPGQLAWIVHLRDPSNKVGPQVMLNDESVSTSEQTARSLLGNETAGHIIDPETGLALKTMFAVSAISKTATVSDALSTTLLLVGPTKGKALLKNVPHASAVWVSPDAQVEKVVGGPPILFSGASTSVSLGKLP
jgi:thiamine biosynthesis lipoprotein